MRMQCIMWVLAACSLVLCASCNSHTKHPDNEDVRIIDKSILQTACKLPTDTIENISDYIYAQRIRVYQDSVLIVQNRKHSDGYFLELYNISSCSKIASLFRLGDGPDEMLSARIEMIGNMLYVNDYVKGQIAVVNIDSILYDDAYSPHPRRHYALPGVPTAMPYIDGGYLVENPYCFSDDNLGVSQQEPRLVVIDGKLESVIPRKHKYNTRNVSVDGCIIPNYKKNRILYANMGKSTLEVFDKSLNKLHTIAGPVVLKAKYIIGGQGCDANEICYDGFIPYAYLNYYANDDEVYLSYVGDYLYKGARMCDLPGWILKYDWDGQLLACYKVGRCVRSISKCGDSLYVTILNEEETPVLLKMNEK